MSNVTFSRASHYDMLDAMQVYSIVARLLGIIAVLGLLAAPMTLPSIAAPMDEAVTAAKADAISTSDEMPCCPHDRAALPDCSKSCPFAVLCTAMFFPANSTAFVPARLAVVDVKVPGDDIGRDLLRDPPPPKPPRD